MDVYNYVGDSFTFSSIRHPMYRDFEKLPYGTLETVNPSLQKSPFCIAQAKIQEKKVKKEPCPFCKEQKKRPLGAYMRRRENTKRYDSICEEEEECNDQNQQKCQAKK